MCLFVCLFVCLSIYLFIYLFPLYIYTYILVIYPSIYSFILSFFLAFFLYLPVFGFLEDSSIPRNKGFETTAIWLLVRSKPKSCENCEGKFFFVLFFSFPEMQRYALGVMCERGEGIEAPLLPAAGGMFGGNSLLSRLVLCRGAEL